MNRSQRYLAASSASQALEINTCIRLQTWNVTHVFLRPRFIECSSVGIHYLYTYFTAFSRSQRSYGLNKTGDQMERRVNGLTT